MTDVNYKATRMTDVNYKATRMTDVIYKSRRMTDVNWKAPRMTDVIYKSRRMTDVNWKATIMTGVNFKAIRMTWVNIKAISLTHVILPTPEHDKCDHKMTSLTCEVGLSTFHPYLYTSTLKKVTGPVTHKQNRTFIQVFMYLSLACHSKIKEPDHSDNMETPRYYVIDGTCFIVDQTRWIPAGLHLTRVSFREHLLPRRDTIPVARIRLRTMMILKWLPS